MKINANHYLEDDNRIESHPMTKALSNPPGFKDDSFPDTVIIHYTAMYDYKAAINSLSDRKKDGTDASAHLVIGKEGQIAQLAPFNYKTWHAGTSSYNGREHFNNFSIGIEIDNLGWLKPFDDEHGKYYSREKIKHDINARRQPEEIVKARHWNTRFHFDYWDMYTDEQVQAVTDICKLLCEHYNIQDILGHDEIAVNRKSDPGPAFPLGELRYEVLNFDRRDEAGEVTESTSFDGIVTATKLNFRSGPGSQNPKIAQPLLEGTNVQVLEKVGDWYRIKTEVTGWVSANHIKKL